jgi:hypothetical protein
LKKKSHGIKFSLHWIATIGVSAICLQNYHKVMASMGIKIQVPLLKKALEAIANTYILGDNVHIKPSSLWTSI